MSGRFVSERPRYSSDANSMSSSSVVTLRSSDTKAPVAAFHTSPNLRGSPSKKDTSPSKSRLANSSSLVDRISSSVQEGFGNLNRWSQSTGSSADRERPKSFSKRFSLGPANGRAGLNASQRTESRASVDIAAAKDDERQRRRSMSISASPKPRSSHRPPTALPLDAEASRDRRMSSEQARRQSLNQPPLGSSSAMHESVDNAERRPAIPTSNHRRGSSPTKNTQQQNGQASSEAVPRATRPKTAEEREKKAMLSTALQKANNAVELDHTQQYAVAKTAYEQACALIGTVIMKSSNEEDKRKLDSIRTTYVNRIRELDQIASQQRRYSRTNEGRTANMHSGNPTARDLRQVEQPIPRTQAREKPTELSAENKSAPQGYQARGNPVANTNPTDADSRHPDWSRKTLLPSPLKIRRQQLTSTSNQTVSPTSTATASANTGNSHHQRNAYGTKHPADKSESYQHHNPANGHDTEADFDAALDAAVEAVYDDGLEPNINHQGEHRDTTDYNSKDVKPNDARDVVANGTNDPRDMPHQQHSSWQDSNTWRKSTSTMSATRSGPSMSAEDQERFLAGFSKDFSHGSFMNGSTYGSTTTSSLPRQSNSSGFSGGTWASSVASSLTTIGTSQSAVEESAFGDLAGEARQSYLPPLPHYDFRTSQILNSKDSAQSIVTAVAETSPNPDKQGQETSHGRRLSTRNAKQLTIDTGAQPDSSPAGGSIETFTQSSVAPAAINNPRNPARRTADDVDAKDTDSQATSVLSHRFASSPLPQSSTVREQTERDAPPPERLKTAPSDDGRFASHQSVSTDHLPVGASIKSFNANRSETIAGSPELSQLGFVYNDQPGHSGFQHAQRQPHSPLVSTPVGCDPSGSRIYANDVHNGLETSDSRVADVPVPLEPCPDMPLLRPFWLMRCLFQTLTHSRGGYLSSRLFIPRDVWKVKNVKLKNLDDKIANCHLLTSALLRLRPVNFDDAETLLTAMQVFDTVLDQVQTNLGRRLGGDVGPQSLGSLYRDAALASPVSDSGAQAAGGSGEGASGTLRSGGGGGTGGKSFLGSSWRKMRSKESNASLGKGATGARDAGHEAGGHMASIPMSSAAGAAGRQATSAELHREASSRAVEMTGPNAGYANALIRLFDAVGVLDAIVHRVADARPRPATPTHVWLDMIARHAAEVLGLYVCRFVLADVTLLADKFCKRASEWSQA